MTGRTAASRPIRHIDGAGCRESCNACETSGSGWKSHTRKSRPSRSPFTGDARGVINDESRERKYDHDDTRWAHAVSGRRRNFLI